MFLKKTKKTISRQQKKFLNEEIVSSDSNDDEDVDIDAGGGKQKAAVRRKRGLKGLNTTAAAAAGGDSDVSYDSEADRETPQEKRLRLAKKYLESIEGEERLKNDGQDVDSGAIGDRLREDILEKTGRLHRQVADNYYTTAVGVDDTDQSFRQLKNGHKLSVTIVLVTNDQRYVFSAGKDSAIVKWDFAVGKRVKTIAGLKTTNPKSKKNKQKNKKNKVAAKKSTDNLPNGIIAKPAATVGHSGHILAMAISSDDRFLATGCTNKVINVWNPETMQLLKTFGGHRGPVSGLVFRRGFHQLFSSSFDRSVKVWNLDEMSYVETLFGHQDTIQAIDSYVRDRAITVGARDSTARVWKIPEESQLVFHGSQHSIDCVKLLDEQHFVTADDNGSLSLWSVLKKKPLTTYPLAHGMAATAPNWVTAVAVIKNTDLIATGSCNGLVRLWKCSQDFRKLEPIINISVTGFVNSLEFSPDGKHLVAGIGQEHRLGRWFTNKEAKNCVLIIPLSTK
ncbi:U3 small nucleolar RNA-interacting protein 2-like [Oppia nitens]|uniref:U3 small nucleolar RNA-interacting protein 2-like n=1 Tax=Oppia nitens TaxID=1686743 RepID=UPI0023DA1EA2|nr:U3 small nucleolar RNA-interacting protein 2-like [Oppia nitens]